MAARILLIDDHELVRAGARSVLQSSLDDIVVEEADSISAALVIDAPAPAVVVLDVRLHGISGIEGLGLLKKRWPNTPVLMLSSYPEPETVEAAMAHGAAAFLSKADAKERMVAVVQGLLTETARRPLPSAQPTEGLTPRQLEVLDLLCQGLSNKAIANRLDISEFTVRAHVQALFRALSVSSRTEAVFVARCRGLVT